MGQRRGQLNAYQLPTGTVVVRIEDKSASIEELSYETS